MNAHTSCCTCWQPADVLASTVQHAPDGRDFLGAPRPLCNGCALDAVAGIGTTTSYDYRMPYTTAVQLTPLTRVRLGKTCPPSCTSAPGHHSPHTIGA